MGARSAFQASKCLLRPIPGSHCEVTVSGHAGQDKQRLVEPWGSFGHAASQSACPLSSHSSQHPPSQRRPSLLRRPQPPRLQRWMLLLISGKSCAVRASTLAGCGRSPRTKQRCSSKHAVGRAFPSAVYLFALSSRVLSRSSASARVAKTGSVPRTCSRIACARCDSPRSASSRET